MSLTKTVIPQPDGSTREHYDHDAEGGRTSVVYSGPSIFGRVTLADGTTYEVNDPYTEVLAGHLGETMHRIGLRFEDEGHPKHTDRLASRNPTQAEVIQAKLSHPFVHLCDDTCGAFARPIDEILAKYDEQLDALGHGDVIGTSEHDAARKTIKAQHAAHLKLRKAILASQKAADDA